MEREYLHFLQSGGFSASAADDDYATTTTSSSSSSSRCFQYSSSSSQSHGSSSSIDAMFSGVSFLSLLTSPPTPPPSPPPPPTTTTATTSDPHHHDYPAMTSLLPLDDHLQLPPLDLPCFLHDPICSLSSLANPTPTPTFGFFPELAGITATPTPVKPEPFSMDDLDSISSFTDPPPFVFPHLPDLLSLDYLSPFSSGSSSSFHKRPRVLESACSAITPPNSCYCHPHHYYPPPPTPCTVHKTRLVLASSSSPQSSPPPRGSALARQRRQRLSDKTRCLQKLLPWDKKMNIATTLEEAYKYIKFLQAQLRALQSMPSHSLIVSRAAAAAAAVDDEDVGAVFSALGRLTRNQLLQVVVNSPVAQTMLFSRGYCVFAEEQLDVLKRFTTQRTMMTSYDSMRFCPDYSYKLA